MADCKIIYTNGIPTGIEEVNSTNPSQAFQEILNNSQVKNFDEALQIYKNMYADKLGLKQTRVQGSGFFSNAEQALINLKDKSVKNVKGWISQLIDTQKNGGIKNVNQELEWTGLEDYLNEYVKENNPKAGNIPSSVVEDYIKLNQIEIVDISKEDYLKPVSLTFKKLDEFDEDDYGSTISSYEEIEEVYEDDEVGYQILKTDEGYYVRDERTDNVYKDDNYEYNVIKTFEEAVRIAGLHLAGKNKTSKEGTKYEGYQLKGGEAYREVLLTMPSKKIVSPLTQIEFYQQELGLTEAEIDKLDDTDERLDNVFEKWVSYQNEYHLKNVKAQENQYKSSHWSEENILAHVRLNEKTLPDGRRVLIVNEVQSDWAQQGRKDGFKRTKQAQDELIAEHRKVLQELGELDAQIIDAVENKKSNILELAEKKGELIKKSDELRNDIFKPRAPQMPYKNTDQWVGLVTRRVMQMASQEGYDGIAFATGQQSADMYSLSQQVDKIDITPQGDIKAVYISMKNNADNTVFINQEGIITESASGVYNGKQAEEVLGKDLTRKILETEEETTLEGEGLEFGGEGMKTFYDKIVPKVVQKEAQRFDKNAKLETVDFSEKVLSYNEIQEMLQDFEKYPSGSRERADLRQQQETAPDTDKLSLGVQPYLPLTQSIKDSVSQGVPLFSISYKDPQIKYQTQDGRIFSEYKDALKNTQGENIKAGINTVEGLKEFFSISSNTSLETTEGFINNMIKSGLLSGKTYKEKGNVNHIAEGNSEAKKILNAQAVKEMFQKQFGKSAVRVNGDNTITIIEDNKRDVIKITNKKGEKVTLDNTKTFEELIKEFDKETVASILANRLYKEATPSKSKVEEVKIVPENELIEKLISLLKKFGIQTMAFDTYLKGYSDRNSLPINAKALADIVNKLIAFKDGIVENDDLIEEISHLIEASIPMSQKENILRNIHKTKEWMDNYDTYKDLYTTEEELRREILGKVIANSLKENFALRESNQTENAIIAKIKELFDQFIQSIKNYFQDSYIADLDKLTQDVYTNLMNESLDLNLENNRGVFFSTTSASPTSFKLLNTAKTLLDKARLLENALGKKYRNPANRASLELATEQIDNATKAIKTAEELRARGEFDKAEKALEKAEDLMAVASLVRLTSSQVNILEKSINNMTDKLLSPEENVVFQYLKDNVVDSLAEVKYNLKESNSKIEAELIQEIDQINKKIGSITGAFENNKKKVFDNIINRQVASMELETEKEQEEYRAIISAHLNGVQKDTDYIHSILGSLLHSRNAILNLAGNVIERMNQKQRDNFQQSFKKFINSKITNTDLEKLIVDWNIIHEIDIAKQEVWIKEQKLKIIKSDEFKLITSIDLSRIDNIEDIDAYIEENASAVGLKLYKSELKKVLKGRFETYFKKEFIEEMKNHSIVLDGKTLKLSEIEDSAKEIDDRYKEQSTQILINAGGNLTKADHEARRQISKNRQIEANPRNADGTLKDGIKEVYDEAKGQYVVMLDASPSVWNRMSVEDRQNVKTIIGLNHISYIKQDFFKDKNEDKKGQPIPDKFIEAVKALKTNEEKMEFIRNNSYIAFPDNYFDELNKTKNIVDRLREALSDEKFEDKVEDIENLIKRIRSKQSITSRVLKANKVFNSPGETNFTDMNKVAMDEVRLAQTDLEALYTEARPFLEESEMEALDGVDNITNEVYRKYLEDSGTVSFEDKILFIQKHTTQSSISSISKVVEAMRGRTTLSKKMQEQFPNGLDEVSVLKFAENKLLPYFKKTEPEGYSELMQQIDNEEVDADEILNRGDLVKITPTITYYENIDENVNPKWLENRDAKKEQYTESYLKEVGNSEFETMFKVGADGKRNNQDLWEKREALLEYYDQMIEYNNLTGSQSRYMYPGVRRTGVERAQSVSFKGVKESLIELIEFRPEEKEMGELTAHSLYTIPTYYTSPLKEKEEHTKNYLGAFLEYGQAATLHNARQESVGDMLVLGDNLEKTEVHGKALGTSNSYKMFKSFMEYNYYGVKENFNYEVQLGTRTVDVGKILRVLNSFAKRVNLSGFIVPITNIFQGSIQKNMEKMIGETINSEASLRGNKKFQKYAPDSMKEVGGLTSNSVLNVVMESLGVVNLHSRFMDAQFGKAGRLALNSESRLHEAANFAVVPRAVLGIIADYKIVDGRIISSSQFKKKVAIGALKDKNKQWSDYENFDDYYYSAVKDGVLDFKDQAFLDSFKGKIDLEGQELIDYLQDKKENISMRALSFTQRVDSQVPMHQKSVMARHGIANFFLSHLNYLLVALPNKTKHRHFNTAEDGQEQEGSWRTTWNFLAKVVVNPKNTIKAYKEASDVEKRNLKRTMMEVAYANALAFAALLLANMNDDEPDPLYPLALADMFLTRVATEQIGSTIALPKSAMQVFDKPLMLKSKIGDWMEVHKLGGTSEQRSSYLNKLLPYYKEAIRFEDPLEFRKKYYHFSTDDGNLFYNYALMSRFLKEDRE